MPHTRLRLLALIVTLSGCETITPVAVSCPPPPPPPAILIEPASTGDSLVLRYQALREELRKLLEQAQQP